MLLNRILPELKSGIIHIHKEEKMKNKFYFRFPNGLKKRCTYDRAIVVLRKLQIKGCLSGEFEEISKEEYKKKEEA